MAIDNITKRKRTEPITLQEIINNNSEAKQILEAMQDFIRNRELYNRFEFRTGINFFYDALKDTGIDLRKMMENEETLYGQPQKKETLYRQLQEKEINTMKGFQIIYN